MEMQCFGLPQKFTVHTDSGLGSLHTLDVDSLAKVSKVYAASIIREILFTYM
jgi:hypothetical protein